MGSSNKVVSGVFWSTIVNVVNGIYGFISVPMLIDYFGKSEYGLIGLAMSINVYLRLMDMGFNSTNLRFFSNWLTKGNKEKARQLFQSSLAFYGSIGVINAIILFILSTFSEQLFSLQPAQAVILKHLIYILMASAFVSWFSSCFDQLIKATENVAWCQRLALLPKAIQIVVLFCTIYFHFSITMYFLLTTFAMFTMIPFSVKKIRVETPFMSFKPKLHWTILKETLPYCLNIFSFGIFQFSFYNLRPVFLGIQGSIESVTDYRILNGIAAIIMMFGGAFMTTLLPSSAKVVARGDKEAYFRVVYDGTKYISIVCSFCCFGMMSVSSEVISLYVGDSYLYLIPWFNLWLLCTLGTHNQAISSLILSGVNIRAITYNTSVSSIVGLVTTWLLIPVCQIGGVVIAYIVYSVMQLLFYYIYYWPRKMGINSWKVFSQCFVPTVILGAILSAVIMQFSLNGVSVLVSFFSKGAIFLILFVLGTYFQFNNADKEFLLGLVKGKIKNNG